MLVCLRSTLNAQSISDTHVSFFPIFLPGVFLLGFDRYLGILASKPTLRDVIAFPKMSSGKEAMTDAPSEVSTERLDEYFLNVKPVE